MNLHKTDLNRVEFMAGGYYLPKVEHILKNDTKSVYEDINDVLELYNIKQYIDNELYLKNWTQEDILDFKQKVFEYGRIVSPFFLKMNDYNVISYYEQLIDEYIDSFWKLIDDLKIYRQISVDVFVKILSNEPHIIRTILTHKDIVTHYNIAIRNFLLTYSYSAEILISIYEERDDSNNKQKMFLPKNLTIQDKEEIVSRYIDSEDCNPNYLCLIQNAKKQENFKLSDKTRLKAKKKEEEETKKVFKNNNGFKYGVSVSFPENREQIKEGHIDNFIAYYSYSLDFIKKYSDAYSLFLNFKNLFEYIDVQNRIDLVSKKNQLQITDKFMGVHSQNEYICGVAFNLSEMTSQAQIVAYSKVINKLENSVENILQNVFTLIFQEKYQFATNAQLLIPSANLSYFEKVILFAPQFERVLKQYKLFVEDGKIDFELLQMSSSPYAIKDIPSLNQNKYFYLNEKNKEVVSCSNLFFSDQTLLAYVEPYKGKKYHSFFDLLANEYKVYFNNYEEFQKQKINYLIDKGYLFIDKNDLVQFSNIFRVLILKDLYENEVASFYHYPIEFQEEAQQMVNQNMIYFESFLFSKPEQSYFNYFLNKSEFTNGQDLRNSYLHGTQANPDEIQKHEQAYFTYLKLLVLILLKIEDDLLIAQAIKNIK
ncbi:MAG: hypothetical protein PHH37_02195 [Paludibacter sp.]|nr:hypothetical protein [Paludibacter sp.]